MNAYQLMHLLSDEKCHSKVKLGGVSGYRVELTGCVNDNGEDYIEFEVTVEEVKEEEEADE